MSAAICSIEGCDQPFYARTWCNKHYSRWRKHGDPLTVASASESRTYTFESNGDRFWRRVDRSDSCWIWLGPKNVAGYGQFRERVKRADIKTVLAHRWSYEVSVGPIPDGLTLDHLCRTPLCVNPSHLEPVTSSENVRRANAARTHCKHGHPFSAENTYRRPDGGGRQCRACNRQREQERQRDRRVS